MYSVYNMHKGVKKPSVGESQNQTPLLLVHIVGIPVTVSQYLYRQFSLFVFRVRNEENVRQTYFVSEFARGRNIIATIRELLPISLCCLEAHC